MFKAETRGEESSMVKRNDRVCSWPMLKIAMVGEKINLAVTSWYSRRTVGHRPITGSGGNARR